MSRSPLLNLPAQGAGEAGSSSLVARLAERIRQGRSLPLLAGGAEGDVVDPVVTPTPTPTPTPAPAAQTPSPTPGDPAEGYRKLLEKHQNDTGAVASKLYDENHSLRETNRTLKAKVPADGAVVLTPDQAKAWSAYTALGTPEVVTVIKAEHGQYATERQAAALDKLHGQAADAHGWKPAVLARLVAQDRLEVTLITAKDAAGKEVTTAHVKDGGQDVTLPEYAKAHWGDFLEVLAAKPAAAPSFGTPRTGRDGLPKVDAGTQEPIRKSLVR
jgi:hypothetical protein